MMKREKQRLLVMICLLALLPNSAFSLAQEKKEAPVKREAPGDLKIPTGGTFKFFGSRYFGKLVKGAPYSATATTEHIQKLGDGNQIVRKNEAKVYRDGEGRTRLEQKLTTIGKWTTAGDAPQMTYISDPVTGDDYHLDPRTRTARKSMNAKAAALKRQIEHEKQAKERQEQLKKRQEQHKEREKERQEQLKKQTHERQEQTRKRQEQFKEQEKRRQEQFKEREKERQEESKERELQLKERQKQHELQVKERQKQHELQVKERQKQHELQVKEREKEQQLKAKERELQLKERQKERELQMKLREETLRKEISSPDGRKKVEALGKKMIEGVEAEGRRSTLTIAAGEIGNTLPIEVVDENWYSPDLQVQVMTRHSDPRSGETTYRLTNIKRGEPDRSLFGVPTDYTIVDESRFGKRATRVEPIKRTEPLKSKEPKNAEPARKPETRKVEPIKKVEPAKPPELYL
jgi:hypothetical protein